MGRYISVPAETDAEALYEQAVTYLQELVPGWEPSAGALDAMMLQTVARLAAELREFSLDVPELIFEYFGQDILLIPRRAGTFASFTATVTAFDDKGYDLAVGTLIGVRNPSGDLEAFSVSEDYTIPQGSTSVPDVLLYAVEAGSAANGLSTTQDGDVIAMDAIVWVDSIIGDAPTSGGIDGETDDEYMDRLVDEIRLMAPRPIVPDDFSAMVQRIAGIGRGYPVNLYKADTDQTGQERCITVAVTDEDGQPASVSAKAEALALLQRESEVNQLIYVEDAQYQAMDLTYTVMAQRGQTASEVESSVNQALLNYLSPATWGEIATGTERLNIFEVQNTVRYLELTTVVNNVPGVDYVESLVFAKAGDAQGSADVDISPASGVPVALPDLSLGTLDSTVNLPA